MKPSEYWIARQINTLLQSESSVLDYEEDLKQSYLIAFQEIQKDIEAFYGRYAEKNKISYSEAVRRLSLDEMKRLRKQLETWEKESDKLGLPPNYNRYLQILARRKVLTRLEMLQAQIRFEVEKLAQTVETSMPELMKTNYSAAYYTTSYNISVGVGVVPELGSLDAKGIEAAVAEKWLGENYSDRIWNNKTALIKTLQKVIPQAFSRGLSVEKLSKIIEKELGVSQRNAQRLVRTEINHLENQAARRSMMAAGIKQYQFIATLDMRTSDICRDMDQYIGDLSKAEAGVNMPPMHVQCRSVIVPYFEQERVTRRAARDENGKTILVPSDMTQEEWIKKYAPKDQQAKLLNFVGKYRPAD